METVTIPEFMRPFECTINNVHYGPYAPGTTVEVPAEVAALIRNNAALEPRENPPETIEEEITRIATQIAEAKIAEATEKYVIDLTSLTLTFDADINLTEAGIITEAAFLEMTASGRDIYVKAKDGNGAEWLWLMDAISADGKNLHTTKAMVFGGSGITLVALSIFANGGVVYGFAGIGFAANPYAGGGE